MALAFALVPQSGLADPVPMAGTWCAPGHGPVLFLDDADLGVGEHTMCDWAERPGGASALRTTIRCHAVYYPNGEAHFVDPRAFEIDLRLADADHLTMRVDQEPEITLERCDD